MVHVTIASFSHRFTTIVPPAGADGPHVELRSRPSHAAVLARIRAGAIGTSRDRKPRGAPNRAGRRRPRGARSGQAWLHLGARLLALGRHPLRVGAWSVG